MDPVDSLIGTLLIAFGVMLVFGAVKNKRIFGSDGILSQALSKGSIVSTESVPDAFWSDAPSTDDGPGKGGRFASRAASVENAVGIIGQTDKNLANQILPRVQAVYSTSTREDLAPLAGLLKLADSRGLVGATTSIRAYVLEETGESI